MSYVLNQYNQPNVDATPTSSSNNQIYMTQITGATPKRRQSFIDLGVVSQASQIIFYNECVKFDAPLLVGDSYYFHCKIKRMNTDQLFYIYLVNYEDFETVDAPTQYLKTITVARGDTNEWVDFEMTFSPLLGFNCILFELQRIVDDYRVEERYPRFVYEEFSHINNLVSHINANSSFFKMGIQSRPGLMMCLNKEEIHVGRSGVYEVRNGIIVVDFLSVLAAATEDLDGSNPLTNPDTGEPISLDDYLSVVGHKPTITGGADTNSTCIFDTSKKRKIDAFTLDYMYELEEE